MEEQYRKELEDIRFQTDEIQGQAAIPPWVKKMDSFYVHFTLTIPILIWSAVLGLVSITNDGQSVIYRTSYLLFFIAGAIGASSVAADILFRNMAERRIGCAGKGRFSYFYQLAQEQETSANRYLLYSIACSDVVACIGIGVGMTGGIPLAFYILTQIQPH